MAEIKTDLNRDLEFEEEKITVSGGHFSVTNGHKTIFSIETKKISNCLIEEGLGICHLVVCTKGRKKVEVAYFTKNRLEIFRKFIKFVNQSAVKGKESDMVFEDKKHRIVGSISTLSWLYGFAAKYKLLLFVGSFFALLAVLVGLVPPYLLKVLIDNVILSTTKQPNLFVELTAVLIISYALSTVVNILQNYFMVWLATK